MKADKIEREKRRIEVENRIALEKKKADLESNETQNRSEIDSKEKADEAEGKLFFRIFTCEFLKPYFQKKFYCPLIGQRPKMAKAIYTTII